MTTETGLRDDRVPVDLRAHIRWQHLEQEARVIDIGFGGAGIVLSDGTWPLEPDVVFQVEIEGIGSFGMECRWHDGTRLGARFADEDAAEGPVQAFFRELGLDPA